MIVHVADVTTQYQAAEHIVQNVEAYVQHTQADHTVETTVHIHTHSHVGVKHVAIRYQQKIQNAQHVVHTHGVQIVDTIIVCFTAQDIQHRHQHQRQHQQNVVHVMETKRLLVHKVEQHTYQHQSIQHVQIVV